jgi:hypothetical protein
MLRSMIVWRGVCLALLITLPACGGSEFDSAGAGGVGGGGGNAGNAGVAGSGGSSGSGGTAGAPAFAVVGVSATEVSTADVPTLGMAPLPSAGSAIIVGISCLSTMEHCTIESGGVTDNQGNSYTRVIMGEAITSSSQGARAYIFIAEDIGVPSGSFVISVDPNGTVPPDTQTVVWGAIEVTGLAQAPSLDASGSTLPLGTDATATTASTDRPTTQPSELAVAVLTMRSEDTNMLITPEATWTSHHSHQNGASGPPGHSMVSKLLTSADTISHTWTHDAPTRGVAAVIATFKAAAHD